MTMPTPDPTPEIPLDPAIPLAEAESPLDDAPTQPLDEQDTRRAAAPVQRDAAMEAPTTVTCPQCGGVFGTDGYCTTCGAKAVPLRDHFTETPAAFVAGVCDRGQRHQRNEDAMALWAQPAAEGQVARAGIVVCDGVSTSEDSDVASLAGARAAREVLMTGASMVDAVAAANAAVIAHTAATSANAAACTFVGATIEGSHITVGCVGDSRAYWIDDDAAASRLLTTDDSIAAARIAMGVSREEAEHGFQAHAITKWLGRDAEDTSPTVSTLDVTSTGWLLVCSDGLWNDASEPSALASLFQTCLASLPEPTVVALAEALVAWANEQGGRDNITVALARFGDWPGGSTVAARLDDAVETEGK